LDKSEYPRIFNDNIAPKWYGPIFPGTDGIANVAEQTTKIIKQSDMVILGKNRI
tara:strand:+ start:337 stop:498 length:162 start_codon:yes stop_codon:yes gene_type:complete